MEWPWIVLFLGAFGAGLLGAMTGLGGGVLLVPLLVDFIGLSMPQAVAASLVAMIMNSAGASLLELREGSHINLNFGFCRTLDGGKAPRTSDRGQVINTRFVVLFSLPAVIGAVIGGWTGIFIHGAWVVLLFGVVVTLSAILSLLPSRESVLLSRPVSQLAEHFNLSGVYNDKPYHLKGVPFGLAWMTLAGWLSGVLGIGSGVMSVAIFNRLMAMPFRVATATSNTMIGIIVAASVGFYYFGGDLPLQHTATAAIGMLFGAMTGVLLAPHVRKQTLKVIFSLITLSVAIRMVWQGVSLL